MCYYFFSPLCEIAAETSHIIFACVTTALGQAVEEEL